MNFIDLIFLFLLIGMMALGFFQGTIRLLVLIFAFYLSVFLASLYFDMLGGFLYANVGGSSDASDYIGFLIITIITFAVLTVVGLYTFRYVELPTGALQLLSRVLGVFLGLILAGLVLGMLAVILWNMFVTHGAERVNVFLFPTIGRAVRTSTVLGFFGAEILPETYNLVRPFLPPGASFIFAIT